MLPSTPVLDRIDRYADLVARSGARAEPIGGFTVFCPPAGTDDRYARPTIGAAAVSTADIAAVRARQRALGLSQSIEWIASLRPELSETLRRAGFAVVEHPLLVLDVARLPAADPRPEPLAADSPDLALVRAVQDIAFGGRDGGREGGGEEVPDALRARDRAAARMPESELAGLRDRLATRRSIAFGFRTADSWVAAGTTQPAGGVAEITGIATLPGFRRRGFATAVTVALARAALAAGVTLVYLSAQDDAAARLYCRAGFVPVGLSGVAAATGATGAAQAPANVTG